MIEFRDVTVIYDNDIIGLENVSFKIADGEFVFLVGKTGAGKSSAVKLLTGEVKPYAGDVIVNGITVNRLKKKKLPYLRRSVGVVFQDFRLLPNKTVYENVAFAMEVVRAKKREIRRKVPTILSLVGLSDRAKTYPNELSGGEQQRVCIARALVNSPAIVVADEPTGNLDMETAEEIMKLLMEINRMGTTIVMVTHSSKIVDDAHRRVIQLESGVVVRDEMEGGYNSDVLV